MQAQNPCLFTLAFPDQGGEPSDRRVWIIPFGYDAQGVDENDPEATENATLEAARRAKPALSELLSRAAAQSLQAPLLQTPVALALERIQKGLDLGLDWFGFDAALSELGPGWARASARGLAGLHTGAAAAALALCMTQLSSMGVPIRAAKASAGLLDFCEERSDDVPGSSLRGLTAHSLELFAKGFSLSAAQTAPDAARRPVACLLLSAPDNADGSPGERGAIFWPAPREEDRTARMKQSIQLVKAALDAKRRVDGPALDALAEIGAMFGGNGALERSRVDAPFAAPTQVERVELSNAKLASPVSPEDFAKAFKALAQEVARQIGPACALGGESAKALAHGMVNDSLEPDEWSGLSRLMARVFEASPIAPAPAPPSPPGADAQSPAARAP